MDPAIQQLATQIMVILIPFVSKSAEEFARSAGKDAYEKVKSLFSILKERWIGDKEATDSLAHFQEKPERYQSILKDILEEKIDQDEVLRLKISQLLKEMGPSLEVFQRMKEAKMVTGAEVKEMRSGRASIQQEFDKGEDVTGFKADVIG